MVNDYLSILKGCAEKIFYPPVWNVENFIYICSTKFIIYSS